VGADCGAHDSSERCPAVSFWDEAGDPGPTQSVGRPGADAIRRPARGRRHPSAGRDQRKGTRYWIVAALIVCSAACALADLEGSTVELVEPAEPVDPDVTYTFTFRVCRDASSEEVVTDVVIMFCPSDLTLYGETMGYDEIVPGRPSFEQLNELGVAHWSEVSETGGIHAGESTLLWIDVHTGEDTPPASQGLISWSVLGADGGINIGHLYFYTPVEARTWSAIKSLYRKQPRDGRPPGIAEGRPRKIMAAGTL
jgi:hypothetical protein